MSQQERFVYMATYDLSVARARETKLDALDVCTHYLYYWSREGDTIVTGVNVQIGIAEEPTIVSATFLGPALTEGELLRLTAVNGVIPSVERGVV